MFNTGENSDFIDGIEAIFRVHCRYLNFLESVQLFIFVSADQVNLTVRAIAQLPNYLEIVKS